MASVKCILAAIDAVSVNSRHVHTNPWGDTKKDGWFCQTGYTEVETITVVLTGRLGRLEVMVTASTDYTYHHSVEDCDIRTITCSKPTVTAAGLPEKVSLVDIRRVCDRLGCHVLNY